jgi:hypothetical protein
MNTTAGSSQGGGGARHSRPVRAGIVASAALIATTAGILLWLLVLAAPWRLATGLRDAGDHLQRGERTLSATRLRRAQYEVLAGAAAADRARAGLSGPSVLFDVAGAVPRLDALLAQTGHLVSAAEHSADAARGTLDIGQNALRGKSRIIVDDPEEPGGGAVVRLERVQEVRRTIAEVQAHLKAVVSELSQVEPHSLPRRTRPTIAEGMAKARRADGLLDDAEAGLELLPGFLGADGPRTYLIGMQNPAEQRGTGGAILRFAELTIDEGRPSLQKDSSVYEIDRNRKPRSISLPRDAWYVAGIEDAQRFGNANWSPDWPLSARLMLRYAEASDRQLEGVEFPNVDGFVVLDPNVMEALVPGTGPFRAGPRITANRAVHFLLYRAYATHPAPQARRRVLKSVVDGFYERMLDPSHPTELVTGMGRALATKHMMIWMRDPDEQRFVEKMDWDGAIDRAKDSDYLSVVEQNVGGNKFDYYADHATTMDVDLSGQDARISTETTIFNGTFFPQPSWVVGDSGKRTPTGRRLVPSHEPMVNVYVPRGARLLDTEIAQGRQCASTETSPKRPCRLNAPEPAAWDGDEPATHLERGKTVWSATLQIPPQMEASVRFDYRVPSVVDTIGKRKTYRLVVQHQPRVRPETLEVRLRLPDDAQTVVAKGWTRDSDTLVWSHPLTKDVELEVSWRE